MVVWWDALGALPPSSPRVHSSVLSWALLACRLSTLGRKSGPPVPVCCDGTGAGTPLRLALDNPSACGHPAQVDVRVGRCWVDGIVRWISTMKGRWRWMFTCL